MHLKFLPRGTGSAAVAAAYLLASKDASGKIRVSVEVLRGDPNAVAAIADALPFMHRYTSGVASWSPEDAPTRPEIERVVDEFEKTAWAGLDPDRYVWAVVLHRDEHGVHLHIFAARCDLATGLSLNIAPPGWERTFDPLRDALNYEHGWSRPDDPSRARAFRPAPHLAYQSRAARRAGEDIDPDPRREIGMHLLELVDAGLVMDRAGVVAALEECGYDVPRQGEHYVTARDPATGERWRLKGALYERGFDRERFLREAPEPLGARELAVDDDPAAAAWEAVEKARRRRADYNRAYYGPGDRAGRAGVQAGVAGEMERESGPAAGRSAGHDASLAAHLERELGDGAVAAVADTAEPVRARRADAGSGRDEPSLAAVAALAEAARAASPELARLAGEHEHVADRERAVCATSMGEQWLAEAQQEVLVEEEDRPLTVGEKARAVQTAEGRLETDLSRRESAVAATSSGPALLREAFGKRSYGDAPLSFSARERGLGRVERRVDEELRTQEEALRAIPPGERYLSAAEQARAAGAAGPPTLADRESMVRAATQQVGDEFDRIEEELLAIAVGEDLLAEAVGALAGDGRTRSLGERWETCERVKSGVEEELDRREAPIRADPAGEEFLRAARLEVLGAAEREAATQGERARIVKAAAEAKRQTETWNEEKAARVEKLRALPGGLELYHARLADLDPKWSLRENTPPSREHDEAALAATESDDMRLERLRDVLSNEADAACYREVLDQVVGQFHTSDLDNALAAGEKARAEREAQQWEEQRDALVDELRARPGGLDLYRAHLADRDPDWGRNGNDKTTREHIDAALAAAKSDAPRLERLRDVLSDEADAVCYREVLDQVVGQFKTSDLDNALAAGEKARAEREAQQWEEKRDALVDELRALPGGLDLYHAHLADRDPKWDRKRNRKSSREHIDAALGAAKLDASRLERLRGVLSDEADVACYQGVLDQVVGQFKTSDLDNALAAGERKREERKAAALETAMEAAQVAAARSNIQLGQTGVRAIYETGETHAAGLAAVERTTQALDDAANQRLPADTIIGTWNANRSDPGGIAAALDAATAASRREEEHRRKAAVEKRVSRLEQLFDEPASTEVFIAALDDEDPAWRTGGTRPACIDRALDVAERGLGRRKAVAWRQQHHEQVLEAEQRFPGAPRAAWRDAGLSFNGRTAFDRHGKSVSRMLSDRTYARVLAAEGPSAEPEPARNVVQQVTGWLQTEVERQELQALSVRTGAARLAERNRNAVRPVLEKSPPVPKLARLVPDAKWEDVKPLLGALTALENAPEPGRIARRNRNSVRPVSEMVPPAPRPARLVPGATREDAVAAAPLIVRARLPEPVKQELRPSVDIAARELAGEFRHFPWWSYAGGELEQLHSREDRYLECHDTKDGPVEIGMLRIVLERDVYEKACRLVEHPVAEPPTNLGELVLAFIRRLQDAVDHLIDLVLDRAREPVLHPSGAESTAKVRGRNHIEERPDPAPAATSATASAPEPAALNVERVRLAVQAVEEKLPRTRPYPGNPSHRPPALSDERLDHLADTADEFVKTVVTELRRRQAYYGDYARSESERTYLRPRIERRHKENLDAYEKAEAERRLFSRRPPKPKWAEAESVVIEEFEAEQRVVIKDVCRRIQQLSPAAVQQSIRKEEAARRAREHEAPLRAPGPTRDRGRHGR